MMLHEKQHCEKCNKEVGIGNSSYCDVCKKVLCDDCACGHYTKPDSSEVYTTTFEDLEKTAEEFGRVALHLPEHSQIIVMDDTIIGHGFIKQFDNTPYGLTLARRFAIRLCEEDETSDEPFEKLRARYLEEISVPE